MGKFLEPVLQSHLYCTIILLFIPSKKGKLSKLFSEACNVLAKVLNVLTARLDRCYELIFVRGNKVDFLAMLFWRNSLIRKIANVWRRRPYCAVFFPSFFFFFFLRLRKQCRLCQWIGNENPTLLQTKEDFTRTSHNRFSLASADCLKCEALYEA